MSPLRKVPVIRGLGGGVGMCEVTSCVFIFVSWQ